MFNESEHVGLKMEQVFCDMQDSNAILAISIKNFDALANAVEKRLSPDLISTYTASFSTSGELLPGNPDNDSRGMQIFTKLR